MDASKSNERRKRRRLLADELMVAHDADLMLYSGPITMHGFNHVEEDLRARKPKRKNVFLFLMTFGGDAHAAFRIARCVGANYNRLTIVITDACKSAGTLLCLGAHELVMSDGGELGPLDVQLRKQDEINDFGSSLDTMQTLQLLEERSLATFRRYLLDIHLGGQLSTRMAGELASSLAVGLYAELYKQLDPVRLGEVYRTMLIASDYGERLVKKGRNAKEQAIGRLVGGYPSHDFVIDRDEARELFHRVREPTEKELELAELVSDSVDDLDDLNVVWIDSDDPEELEEGANVPATVGSRAEESGAEGKERVGSSPDPEGSVPREAHSGDDAHAAQLPATPQPN